MKTRFLFIRHELNPRSFTLMELDEHGFGTGKEAVYLKNEELARAVDNLEQLNHCKEECPNDLRP